MPWSFLFLLVLVIEYVIKCSTTKLHILGPYPFFCLFVCQELELRTLRLPGRYYTAEQYP